MSKFRALILDEYVEPVLAALQADSLVHLVDCREKASVWEEEFEEFKTEKEDKYWIALLMRVDRIILDLQLKEEFGLVDQLFKPRQRPLLRVTGEEESEALEKAEALLSEVEQGAKERIRQYRSLRSFIHDLNNPQIDIGELRNTKEILVKIGRVPSGDSRSLESKLETRARLVSVYRSQRGRGRFVVVVSLSELGKEIDRVFKEENVEEIPVPEDLAGTSTHCLRWLDGQEGKLLRKYEWPILHLHDAIVSKLARISSMGKLGKAGRVYVMEGWIPTFLKEKACAVIEKASQGHATVLVEQPDEPAGNVPTLLRDMPLIGRFRALVEMYDVPAYNEIDPTPFLAFFFVLFFGLMSADIAVGLTTMLGAYLIIRGAGTRSKGMRDLGIILLLASISTTIFGFLGGEFMGGLLHLPVLWISSAESPIEFMLVALVIGIANITFGIIIGIANNVSKREYRRLVGEQFSALALIAGAGTVILTGNYEFAGFGLLGYALVLGGVGMLLAVQKLIGLLEITKLLSNVISYVRIMAINMSSAWMLRTFILVGEMIRSVEIVGPVLMAILLIFSHLFIVFIFSFSTFAHSLRLIYVEFFGRFYAGGGKRFTPISSDRAYTSIRL